MSAAPRIDRSGGGRSPSVDFALVHDECYRNVMNQVLRVISGASAFAVASLAAPLAQPGPGGPPSVGVARVEVRPITRTNEFVGRIQAIERVDIVARVTAFLETVEFKDGAEVAKGNVLYRLERPPFEADLAAKQAVADQFAAQLQNADIALERAQHLVKSQAGAQANVDTALATQRSYAAQLDGAQANVKQSKINLDYTIISSPIDGKIGRTAVTPGNVVGPGSGTLVTVVGQDPMYVVFPVSVRTQIELRERYVPIGGFDAVVIRIKLPDGRLYTHPAKLDFVDNRVDQSTDTILLRGIIPNPPLPVRSPRGAIRELADREFVTVYLEGVEPVEVLAVPRAAVLTDQRGDYVFVVDNGGKAQRRDVKLGQSTPTTASIETGLEVGELVIVEGLQRVRPGREVMPSPATPLPEATTH
jgi:membrane fusion protein (multidrug efflux system)